jgi:hypothetical protein
MGIVFFAMAIGGLLIASAAAGFGIMTAMRSPRQSPFWWLCVLTAAVSAVCQYAFAVEPLQLPVTVTIAFDPMFGWHLLPPFILSGLAALASRRYNKSAFTGVATGFLFSVTAVVLLAIPIAAVVMHFNGAP